MILTQNDKVPFFSVIITTFNRKKLVLRALKSLREQSYKDWECIIVDDGSSDGTYDEIIPFCRKNEKIKYIFQNNRGPGLAKNTGMLAASGLFITFLDSDDEYLHNHLDMQHKILTSYPDTDFLHSKALIIGDPFVPDANDQKKMIHLNDCVIGGTFVVKRHKALEMGGYPPLRYADDTAFYDKAKGNDLIIRKADTKTYKYYRDTLDSLCNLMIKEKEK